MEYFKNAHLVTLQESSVFKHEADIVFVLPKGFGYLNAQKFTSALLQNTSFSMLNGYVTLMIYDLTKSLYLISNFNMILVTNTAKGEDAVLTPKAINQRLPNMNTLCAIQLMNNASFFIQQLLTC